MYDYSIQLRHTTALAYCSSYGVVSHKASQALRPSSDLLCASHLSSNHSRFIHQSSQAVTSRHLVTKQGYIWREMAVNLADKVSLSCFVGVFNMP
jgi:hypothetical protein